MKRTALNKERRAAFGPLAPFVAARRPSSARGQVARGTFSGPRSRGTRWGPWRAAPSTPSRRATSHDTANGASARTPNHLPRHPSGTPHVAGHRRLKQGGGGAPGRRPHSRCHGSSRAWIVLTRLAVVGLGGAPRAWAGERGRRRRPGAQSLVGWACTDRRVSLEAPGHLPSRGAWPARSDEHPLWGRKLVLPSAGSFHASRVAHSAMDH